MITDDEFEKLRRDPGPIVFDGTQPLQSPETSLQASQTVNDSLVRGVDLEDDEIDDPEIYANHPVDRLWKFCDSAESSVKLLLPDSKIVPYYLKKPRNNKEKKQKELEREQRVFDLYVQREVEEQRSRKNITNTLPKTSALTLHEERIGRDLMLEYKRDPEKLMNLYHKLETQKAEKRRRRKLSMLKRLNKEKASSKSPRVQEEGGDDNEDDNDENDDDDDQVPEMNPTMMLGKMQRVLCRRATLMKEHEKEMQDVVNKWQAKVQDIGGRRKSNFTGVGADMHKVTPLAVIERQDRWVNIVFGMRALLRMKDIVETVRKQKEIDRRRWFALRLIQRFVRKVRRAKRKLHLASLGIHTDEDSILESKDQSPIRTLRRSMAGAEELTLYHKRVESASMVVVFLKTCSKQYRSIMHRYFRKVLIIQRRVRLQLAANETRYFLMQTYFDRIFPSFYAYLSMVLSGKGNDLKNLTSLDQSRLRIHTKQVKQFSVVEGFDSPLFHAFLREFKPIFQNTGRFLGPGRNVLSIQMVNIEKIKRHVLLSLVFRKRHQSATQLESVKPITIPAQTISRSDVLAFIRGERDPVVDYLEEVKRIEDEHRAQYYAKKEASKHGRVYRKFTGKELFLCMLSKITAEEFALAVLNITEIAMMEFDRQTKSPHASHPTTAAGPANRKQGGKRPIIPVPDSTAASGEQVTKVYGRNLSVMAMFMSRTTVADEVPDESTRANANTRNSMSQEVSDNATTEQFNGTASTPASRQGREDTAEMKRMIQETARRVEAEALTQQRQELVQATRRNSMLTGALRRSSIMTGGMNPMAAAAAAAVNIVTGGLVASPTKDPATNNSPASTPAARPGRRLSQFNAGNSLGGTGNSQQPGSGLMIPRKPEERRRSMNFNAPPGSTKGVESGLQSIVI